MMDRYPTAQGNWASRSMDWWKHSNLIFTDFKLAKRATYQTIESLEELGSNIMDSTPSISEAHKTPLTILNVISETRGFD